MVRVITLTLLVAVTAPRGAAGQQLRPSIERPHVLSAVVDDELERLASRTDVGLRLVLMSRHLKPVALGLRAVRAGRIDTRAHQSEWLEGQEEKEGVAGTCAEDTMRACLRREEDVVLALAEPAFSVDGSARLQTAVQARVLHPNGESRHFFGYYLLTLEQVDGRWEVADRRVLGIT